MDNLATANFDFPACISCNFSPFCLSEKTNSHLHQKLPATKQQIRLKRKEILCLPQKKFQSLYAIQKGALKTYKAEANGKEVIRGFYFAGEVLGYEAIYTGHYLTSAVALTDTLVCEVPYNNFLSLVHSKPELQKQLLHLISQQLSVGSYLTLPSAEQRLSGFLFDISKRLHRCATQPDFILPMSRQDIGSYLNLTAETISRIFSRLQRQKILAIQDKKISILREDKLKQMAEGILSLRG